MQVVNYRYNIRGWLTHINNTKGLQNTGDPDDLFSFAIHYTNTEQDYQNQVAPLYNGNIAETLWRSGSDNVERSYGYKYDALNRLTNAIYGKPGNSVKLTHNYNEWLTYDKNGNILTLDRNGISDSYFDLIKIDQLSYEYANNNSNLLVKVTDDTQNFAGFKKGNTTTDNDFTYDDNGNLIADKNKNITQIIYNHLNLPTKITFNGDANQYISYLYNATGEKIQKIIKNTDSLSTTHYINGFQYFDHVLQFFPTPEGYVKNTPTESGGYSFDYVYNYTDHLGNIRLSYTQDPQTGALAILEEQHYYPFGLQHKNYNSDITKINREEELKTLKEAAPPSVTLQNPGYMYKYNGKELQNEFGVEMYDFGARNYDPVLGRWMNIDPLAEKMRRHSPYNYAFNNPIYFIDPDGMEGEASGASGLGASGIGASVVGGGGGMPCFGCAGPADGGKIPKPEFNIHKYDNKIPGLFAKNKNNNNGEGRAVNENNPIELDEVVVTAKKSGGSSGTASNGPDFNDAGWFLSNTANAVQRNSIYNARYYTARYGTRNLSAQDITRQTRSSMANTAIWAKRGGAIATIAFGAYDINEGYKQDGGQFGQNAQIATGRTLGGAVGSVVGAKAGALAGAAIGAAFWGVGAVPGALIGGIIGAFGGGWLGSEGGETLTKSIQN